MDRFERTVNRFLEVMNEIEKMYVNILEEAVMGEAEILEKKELEPVDMIRLAGYRVLKEIALRELGYEETGEGVVAGDVTGESVKNSEIIVADAVN